jgi:hypothetical protein
MKPIFAAAAVVIAGFAVLATAQAGSIKLNLTQGEKVISSRGDAAELPDDEDVEV